MKHLKIAGLCLVSMLAMGVALAGNASAAPLWLLCLPKTGGKFEDAGCTKGGSGSWEFESIWNRTDKVVIPGMTIRLEDSKTAVGKSVVQCGHVAAAGIIGPGNKGRITEASVKNPKTECEAVEGGCKKGEVEKVEGRNLPWQLELFETEKTFITNLEPTAATEKEPGWEVKCNTLLGSKADTCISGGPLRRSRISSGVETSKAALGFLWLVRSSVLNVVQAECSEGGKESGTLEGQFLVELANAKGEPSGLGLSIDSV